MSQSTFYKLRNLLINEKIVFCYSGYMTENILTALGETIKRKLEMEDADLTTTKRVFSIFVEQMQNVIRYSAEKIPEKFENDKELRYGLIAIGKNFEGIFVHCGNLILNDDVKKMKKRVGELSGKDKNQLKKLKKHKMSDGPEEESKGASLGLIEMARRAEKPMEFDFEIIDEKYTFFCVKAIV